MALAVIAGLGNPGTEYAETRHNLGAVVVETLAAGLGLSWKTEKATQCQVAKGSLRGKPVTLLRPKLFMNESGRALGAYARYHKLDPAAFVVAYDDITLELGRLRLTLRGSAGGHNGVADLLQHLGDGFSRYRLGIGGKPHADMPLKDWVLGTFSAEELICLKQRLPTFIEGFHLLWQVGPENAMNQLNTRNNISIDNEPDTKPTPLPGDLHS